MRRCYSIEALEEEIARQKELAKKGWLRRLGGSGFSGVTVEWVRGETSNGVGCWLWASGGTQWGGVWAKPEDSDEAFPLAEFEWRMWQ